MYWKIKKTIDDITSDAERLYDLVKLYDKTESHKRNDAIECIHLIVKLESLMNLLATEWNDNSVEKDMHELTKRKSELTDILENMYHKETGDKVVVHVSGGMVQRVYTTDPDIKVVVEDEDVEEYDLTKTEDVSEMILVY